MSFASELEHISALVEARLDQLLKPEPAGGTRANELAQAMRYAVLGGGKRLRPFLLINSARLFGVPEAASLDAAAALECVHCYSLVHDDLPAMDDDSLRRGLPTAHIAFGEATAILAGDALLTFAFEILSGDGAHPDPAVRVTLIGLLAKASGWRGMALGQALDLAAERQPFTAADIAFMQAMKTGALFQFACDAGAVLGRADGEARAQLVAYATALGQAFQLADDLLDEEGSAEALGKAVAKDAHRGKATLVALLGVGGAKARLAALVDEADKALAPFGENAEMLKETARFIAQRRA
jgi:farnesyl diphosphate synthase